MCILQEKKKKKVLSVQIMFVISLMYSQCNMQ